MSDLFSRLKDIADNPDTLQDEKTRKTGEKKYFRFFQNHNIEKSFLEKKRDEWFIRNGDHSDYNDLIWALWNELLHEYEKNDDFFNMKMLYFEMAFLQKSNGNEFFNLLRESKRMELYDIKKQFENDQDCEVVIISGESDCSVCKELNGYSFTIDEALEKMPVPPAKCSHNDGWCTCSYTIKSSQDRTD